MKPEPSTKPNPSHSYLAFAVDDARDSIGETPFYIQFRGEWGLGLMSFIVLP